MMNSVSIVTFSNSIILDENSRETKVSTLWQQQTVLFIFLRHFGCIACRAHANQIWNDRKKYEVGGARIIFIGNGKPEYVKFFKEDLKIQDAPVYTDPSLMCFKAAGFKNGFRALVNMNSIKNGINLYKQGHKQGQSTKDTGTHWQLGGVLVVKPSGSVAYHYISESLGDFPPEKDLVLV